MAIQTQNLIGTPISLWNAPTMRSRVRRIDNVVLATHATLTTLAPFTPLALNTVTGHYHVFDAAGINGTNIISAFIGYDAESEVVLSATEEVHANVVLEADIEYGEIPATIAGEYIESELQTALKSLDVKRLDLHIHGLLGN